MEINDFLLKFPPCVLSEGLKNYYDENKSEIEEKAKMIYLGKNVEYEQIIDFLEINFLKWMKSRANKSKFEMSIKQNKKLLQSIFKAVRAGESDVESLLLSIEKISQAGPVNASAILMLMSPSQYGVVSKYTIRALGLDSYGNKTVIDAEHIFQELAQIYGDECKDLDTPRKIDMALWGLERLKNKGLIMI